MSQVQRQLERFEREGLLASRLVGRTREYRWNPRCLFRPRRKHFWRSPGNSSARISARILPCSNSPTSEGQAFAMKAINSKTTIAEIGSIVFEALRKEGIDAFLSGGAVVSIYTKNKYESYDLDFVSLADRTKIKKVMVALGFKPRPRTHVCSSEDAVHGRVSGLCSSCR